MAEQEKPLTGDMYCCEKCGMELHVTKPCECDEPCSELKCCGELMKNTTEPEVINS